MVATTDLVVHAADTPAVSDDGKVENGILLFAVKVMA
jgi:hypothetical protein